jgi:hypothetical protein
MRLWLQAALAVPMLLAVGRAGSLPGPPPVDRVSPSFTWSQILPPTGSAGLSGVYFRAAISTELDLYARRTVTRAKFTYWCFFPDGRCYYSMPTEGLDNFNYEYLRGMNDLWCCTYVLNGDQGTITWGTGGSTVPIRRSGSKWLIGKTADAFDRLDPCTGLKLEGTYRRENWRDENSVKAGIAFAKDGTFVDEGFLAGGITTWWWADRGLVDAEFSPGRGTYRLADNSLVLVYDDGRKYRANFHLIDGASKDEVTGFLISTRRFIRVR